MALFPFWFSDDSPPPELERVHRWFASMTPSVRNDWYEELIGLLVGGTLDRAAVRAHALGMVDQADVDHFVADWLAVTPDAGAALRVGFLAALRDARERSLPFSLRYVPSDHFGVAHEVYDDHVAVLIHRPRSDAAAATTEALATR